MSDANRFSAKDITAMVEWLKIQATVKDTGTVTQEQRMKSIMLQQAWEYLPWYEVRKLKFMARATMNEGSQP